MRVAQAESAFQWNRQGAQSDGFESVLATWRLENTRAALRFCDTLLGAGP